MAKAPCGVDKVPKISTSWVGRTNVTDDGRRHSERDRELTFAKYGNGLSHTEKWWRDLQASTTNWKLPRPRLLCFVCVLRC